MRRTIIITLLIVIPLTLGGGLFILLRDQSINKDYEADLSGDIKTIKLKGYANSSGVEFQLPEEAEESALTNTTASYLVPSTEDASGGSLGKYYAKFKRREDTGEITQNKKDRMAKLVGSKTFKDRIKVDAKGTRISEAKVTRTDTYDDNSRFRIAFEGKTSFGGDTLVPVEGVLNIYLRKKITLEFIMFYKKGSVPSGAGSFQTVEESVRFND